MLKPLNYAPQAPVAQLDRVLPSEGRGHRFESCRARQFFIGFKRKDMGENDDKVFLKRFSGIIAGLVIVTILIIVISVGNNRLEPGSNPSRAILAAERVAPVAGSRTEMPSVEVSTDEALATETPAESADTSQDTIAASDIDGASIYTAACSLCHAAGVADAPVPGTDAWAERAVKGTDALVASAIAGLGPIMLPKGGRADLSDEEIRAVIEHMLTL